MSSIAPLSGDHSPARKRRLLIFLPLLVFAAIVALFLVRLYSGDASLLPSAMIGKPAPAFSLPPVDNGAAAGGFSDADLRQGKVTIVNVFASWCVACHEEHAFLMQLAADPILAEKGIQLFGIAYKDNPLNAQRFLKEAGNPFARIGADSKGRVAIDFGVYGVPESYIVKGDGTIAYRFVGPLSEESFQKVIAPEIEKARK